MSDDLTWADIRERVTERARGCCEYCRSQVRFSMQSFSVEHILPVSRGGPDTLDNLALSCQGCNNHKFTKTTGIDPVTKLQAPLFNPRKHRWKAHFAWSSDGLQILGLTPTGRATIEELNLNREGVVNLRRAVRALGEHPFPETEESEPVPPADVPPGNGASTGTP